MFSSIREINANELSDWLHVGDSPFRIIDVREIKEMSSGSVPGAESMPLATIPLRANEMKPHEKLVFVCRSGARSAQACAFLQQKGYSDVYNLRGGMMSWSASGLPALPPSNFS